MITKVLSKKDLEELYSKIKLDHLPMVAVSDVVNNFDLIKLQPTSKDAKTMVDMELHKMEIIKKLASNKLSVDDIKKQIDIILDDGGKNTLRLLQIRISRMFQELYKSNKNNSYNKAKDFEFIFPQVIDNDGMVVPQEGYSDVIDTKNLYSLNRCILNLTDDLEVDDFVVSSRFFRVKDPTDIHNSDLEEIKGVQASDDFQVKVHKFFSVFVADSSIKHYRDLDDFYTNEI